jgi:hypothetical protein
VFDLEFFQYNITIASIVTFEVKSCILISLNMVPLTVYIDAKVFPFFLFFMQPQCYLSGTFKVTESGAWSVRLVYRPLHSYGRAWSCACCAQLHTNVSKYGILCLIFDVITSLVSMEYG